MSKRNSRRSSSKRSSSKRSSSKDHLTWKALNMTRVPEDKKLDVVKLLNPSLEDSQTDNNRMGGSINEYGDGACGPSAALCSPGGGFFSLSRRSGLLLSGTRY